MSYSQKVFVTFISLCVVVMVAFITTNTESGKLRENALELEKHQVPELLTIQKLTSSIQQSLAALRGWVILGNQSKEQTYG